MFVWVCVFVCKYKFCFCKCKYVCVRVFICVCVWVYVCARLCACICVCASICIFLYSKCVCEILLHLFSQLNLIRFLFLLCLHIFQRFTIYLLRLRSTRKAVCFHQLTTITTFMTEYRLQIFLCLLLIIFIICFVLWVRSFVQLIFIVATVVDWSLIPRHD